MKTDKYTKFLLTMIMLGMWTMILKPMFSPAPAQAQAGKRYEFLVESNNKMQIGGAGNLHLTDQEFRDGVRLANSLGWRVHSFTTAVESGVYRHWVLLEK